MICNYCNKPNATLTVDDGGHHKNCCKQCLESFRRKWRDKKRDCPISVAVVWKD